MRALQFGTGSKVYEFPRFDQVFNPRDTSLSTPATQLPGASGGFAGLGYGAAPVQVRRFTLSFRIVANTRAEMRAKRDTLNQILTWGVRRLIGVADDGRAMWINCAVSNIRAPEQPSRHTDLVQPVTVDFIAFDPFWYQQGTEAPLWGDGVLWGGGAVWGGASSPAVCTGTSTTFTVTHAGNTFAVPRVVVTVRDGDTARNIRVQRLFGGNVVDELSYLTTVSASGSDRVLEADCRALSVELDGVDVFDQAAWSQPQNLWWFRLEPGENTIRVLLQFSGDACEVDMRYYDTYL